MSKITYLLSVILLLNFFAVSAFSAEDCEVLVEMGTVGWEVRPVNSCTGLDNCRPQPGGGFAYEAPFTELRIVSAEGEGCHGNSENIVYRALQHFPVKQFKATIYPGNALNASDKAVYFISWTKIRDSLGNPIPGVLDFTTAMPDPDACIKEGQSIGSGQLREIFCCKGLTPASRFFYNGECDNISGGAVCIACGDGRCNKEAREDHCNCPQDCK